MNYEELLNTLNSKQFMDSRTPETPYFALRAVVELHKPTVTMPVGCKHCDSFSNENAYVIAYPCPTIEVIVRELG